MARFLESCGCGPLTTDGKSPEELPETDTWQFVEAHSRGRSVRVVVHPLTADSRTKALQRDMVWEDVSLRERRAASKRVLWAAILLFAALRFKLSPSCPTAADEMKQISDGDTFVKLPWIRS